MNRIVKIQPKSTGASIEIGKEHGENVSEVDISFETINGNVLQKTNAMVLKIIVKGDISPEITPKLIQIFDWARDFNSASRYRTLTATVMEAKDKKLRTYVIDQVFVVNYKEEYPDNGQEGEIGTFEIVLSQKENNFDTVKTFS